jgi:uncharacterized protein with GYD domain
MSRFLLQIRFTSSAWYAMTQKPIDTMESVRAPLKMLDGTLHDAFFTEGAYDLMAMAEFPESTSCDDISVAFYAGGSIAFIHSSPLLAAPHVVEALPAERTEASRPAQASRALAATAG